jgi:mRNA interferase MazF
MKKGEIWIVDIPEIQGHEQYGTRPVIVMSELEANIVLVIPCTSNKKALKYPHVIDLHPTKENGLLFFSVALIFQLRALDTKRLLSKIGKITQKQEEEINNLLTKILQL